MNGFDGELIEIMVYVGLKRSSDVALQLMIFMFTVEIAVLMKSVANTTITINEHMPPEVVL
jgi:hypothetical protein